MTRDYLKQHNKYSDEELDEVDKAWTETEKPEVEDALKKHPAMKWFLIIVGGSLAILCIACLIVRAINGEFSSSRDTYSSSTANSSKSESKEKSPREQYAYWNGEGEKPNADIVIMQEMHTTSSGYGLGSIEGTAFSRRLKDIDYIQISFGVYDKAHKTKMGSCLANETNLIAGMTWKFSAICTGIPDGEWSYSVDDVTYW